MIFGKKGNVGKQRANAGETGGESALPASAQEDAGATIERHRQFSHWIDEAYRDFEKRGGFADLPGKGKPLRLESGDALHSILKNANVVPRWIELQQEIRADIRKVLDLMELEPERNVEPDIEAINAKIKKYNQIVPSHLLQKSKIFRDAIGEQYARWE